MTDTTQPTTSTKFRCDLCGHVSPGRRGLGVHKRFAHGIKSAGYIRKTTGTAKRLPVPARSAATAKPLASAPDPATLTMDEAVELLCAVIGARVATRLEQQFDALIARRIAGAAANLAPKLKPDAEGIRSLGEEQLRDRMLLARARGDMAAFEQCRGELRRRDDAADKISTESRDGD